MERMLYATTMHMLTKVRPPLMSILSLKLVLCEQLSYVLFNKLAGVFDQVLNYEAKLSNFRPHKTQSGK